MFKDLKLSLTNKLLAVTSFLTLSSTAFAGSDSVLQSSDSLVSLSG